MFYVIYKLVETAATEAISRRNGSRYFCFFIKEIQMLFR